METRPPCGSLNVVNAASEGPAGVSQEHQLDHDQTASGLEEPGHALDAAYLASQTFGDIELEVELLRLFVEQARRLVPKLSAGDPGEQTDTAHLLKGSARAVGAQLLATAVEAFEQTGSHPPREDGALHHAIVTALHQTETAIAARLSVLQAEAYLPRG